MKMTVDMDSDAYRFASAYAEANGINLSAAISELVRCAAKALDPERGSRLKTSPHGYLVIAKTGNVITPEMVQETSEDRLF